jgi:hypothetical protein
MGFFRWVFWGFFGWVFYCQPCLEGLVALLGPAALPPGLPRLHFPPRKADAITPGQVTLCTVATVSGSACFWVPYPGSGSISQRYGSFPFLK